MVLKVGEELTQIKINSRGNGDGGVKSFSM